MHQKMTDNSSQVVMNPRNMRNHEEFKRERDDISFKDEQENMRSADFNSFAGHSTHVKDEEATMREESYSNHQPATLCSASHDFSSTHFTPDDDAKQSRNFFFTVHKYRSLHEFFAELKDGCLYARAQEERGEGTGKLHIQACVGYKTQRRLRTIRDRFPGAHVQFSRSAVFSWEYCGKQNTRVGENLSVGIPPIAYNVAGQRHKEMNDFLVARGPTNLCKEGAISVLRYKHIKENVDEFKRDLLKPAIPLVALSEDCLNEWHWGSTRLGKTWYVEHEYPGGYHKTDSKWWNGY